MILGKQPSPASVSLRIKPTPSSSIITAYSGMASAGNEVQDSPREENAGQDKVRSSPAFSVHFPMPTQKAADENKDKDKNNKHKKNKAPSSSPSARAALRDLAAYFLETQGKKLADVTLEEQTKWFHENAKKNTEWVAAVAEAEKKKKKKTVILPALCFYSVRGYDQLFVFGLRTVERAPAGQLNAGERVAGQTDFCLQYKPRFWQRRDLSMRDKAGLLDVWLSVVAPPHQRWATGDAAIEANFGSSGRMTLDLGCSGLHLAPNVDVEIEGVEDDDDGEGGDGDKKNTSRRRTTTASLSDLLRDPDVEFVNVHWRASYIERTLFQQSADQTKAAKKEEGTHGDFDLGQFLWPAIPPYIDGTPTADGLGDFSDGHGHGTFSRSAPLVHQIFTKTYCSRDAVLELRLRIDAEEKRLNDILRKVGLHECARNRESAFGAGGDKKEDVQVLSRNALLCIAQSSAAPAKKDKKKKRKRAKRQQANANDRERKIVTSLLAPGGLLISEFKATASDIVAQQQPEEEEAVSVIEAAIMATKIRRNCPVCASVLVYTDHSCPVCDTPLVEAAAVLDDAKSKEDKAQVAQGLERLRQLEAQRADDRKRGELLDQEVRALQAELPELRRRLEGKHKELESCKKAAAKHQSAADLMKRELERKSRLLVEADKKLEQTTKRAADSETLIDEMAAVAEPFKSEIFALQQRVKQLQEQAQADPFAGVDWTNLAAATDLDCDSADGDKKKQSSVDNKSKPSLERVEQQLQLKLQAVSKERMRRQVQKEVEVQKAQLQSQLKDASLCTICYDRQADHTLSPCGHLLCLPCSKLDKCPTCRKPIKGRQKSFLPSL